jgi:prolyl oligopeptidase
MFTRAAFAILLGVSCLFAQNYPPTRKDAQIDDYHGTRVPDPYRWLENDRAPEVADWVKAENNVTFSYLSKIPYRQRIHSRLTELIDYPRYTVPIHRANQYFFQKNEGLQNQSVWYAQTGSQGKPALLIDPNKLSKDGTSRLVDPSFSRNGKHFAYGVSTGGSDWVDVRVMEVASRKTLAETLKWVKVSALAWSGDGFYYSRYPTPEAGHELTTKNEFHRVYFHRVGTPQTADALVYEDNANPRRFHIVITTEDERFALLIISDRGTGKRGNALWFRDLQKPGSAFEPIVREITDDDYDLVDNIGPKFLIQTNNKAPNGKVVLFDPASKKWSDVLSEKPEPLTNVVTAGGKLFATYLKEVATHAYVYSEDGKLENEITLPGLGDAEGFLGLRSDKEAFYTFTSFTYAPTIFRYDIATQKSTPFRVPKISGYDPAQFESKQVFFSSKDGTKIPMFLVYKKGLRLDGQNPAWITGYGGFNITLSPSFSAARLFLLENGFVFASVNMRGGGEYGETWHEAGTKLKKQNVFDDFIAGAEWLIANHYTNPEKLAVNGTSNGGLLVGAVVNQRPDLYRVAIPQAGVMDMLRYQKFTIGWNWIADYGSSDNAQEFKALYAYSPVHNVKQGVRYPSVLITTADHDDRVVSAHSFKYAAALQSCARKDRPVLLRVETNSGHGASSTGKMLDITTDLYAFTFFNLGLTPE